MKFTPFPGIAHDLPIFNMYNTVCKLCNVPVMRDQDDRLTELSGCHLQKSKHLMTGSRIQVAGRFICKDYDRLCRNSPGNRNSLLLSAG